MLVIFARASVAEEKATPGAGAAFSTPGAGVGAQDEPQLFFDEAANVPHPHFMPSQQHVCMYAEPAIQAAREA